MDRAKDALLAVSRRPPAGTPELGRWIQQVDFIEYLRHSVQADELALYAACGDSTFLHGATIPARLLKSADIEDLLHWNHNPYSSWGITYGFARTGVWFSAPLSSSASKTLEKGEQLIYARDFDGRLENRSYIEILQKFSHAFGLHFVPERSAYCRFDDRGDLEEIVRILERSEDEPGGGRMVFCRRSVLDEYLAIDGSLWVRLFDSTRVPPGNFGGWGHEKEAIGTFPEEGLYYRFAIQGSASYLRGVQIVAPSLTRTELAKKFRQGGAPRRYETFLAWDWKHGEERECSCDPAKLGNYFVDSDLPYETSPAFFRPEILHHYKADTDKYQVSDRSITCRNAWHLQSYDINDAGQVHTYLIYLSHLPYEEQRVWKAFNEPRKASISKRAYTTDFQGNFDLEYDPLRSIKSFLGELARTGAGWWKLREADLPEKCQYPATTAADEWARELHALDKYIVDGLEKKMLAAEAKRFGRIVDPAWGSLRILEEVLVGSGHAPAKAKVTMAPVYTLHELRTKLSGHAAGKSKAAVKAAALKAHGSYRKHYRALCADIDKALRTIGKAFR